MLNENKEAESGKDMTERAESDRRGLDDRRQEDSGDMDNERRTPEESRRSWVGRRQAADWRNQ